MKFLFDECLSPELTKLAHAKGYGESTHVVWLGRAGLKDWELKPFILKDDWTRTPWISGALPKSRVPKASTRTSQSMQG
jgi:hypothetical protein